MPSREIDNSGCFSGLLRRLLCADGPPQTHPSDRFPEPDDDDANSSNNAKKVQSPAIAIATTGPGVVARLMGLESLPRTSVQKNPGPVSRSRSVNFMDYLLEFDSNETKHRRVRTSVSFREQPPGLEQNQVRWPDFPAVFSEEKHNVRNWKSEKMCGLGNKQSQREMNVENRVSQKEESQKQRKKSKKISKLKNEPRRDAGKSCSGARINRSNNVRIKRGMNSKKKLTSKTEDRNQARKRRNQSRDCKVEFKQNSDTSSPISVFDSDNFHFHNENSLSEISGSLEMELRYKNTSKKEMNEAEIYLGLAGMLCNLAEEDMKQQSNWINEKILGFEDFEELCLEFGEEILNYMLSQMVDELVGVNS